MEFLNPAALYGFYLLPLLLIPYLIKGRARREAFSSLLLLREISSRSRERPWGRLYLPPLFFLQLLLLILLILALAEPILLVPPSNIAIILDNSASMQADEGGQSRFALAQDEAGNLLRNLSLGARVHLYLTVPRLERTKEEAMSPSEAVAVVSRLRPYDLGDPPGDYGDRLWRLTKENKYERTYFLTDHPAQGDGGRIRVITVGRPKENLALTSFQVTGSSFATSQLEARLEATHFSSREEKIKINLKGGGKVLASRTLNLQARQSISISFQGFPHFPYYEAEIEGKDGLLLDNRRYAVSPASRSLRILAISPRPQPLYSLRSIPGVSLEVIAPEAYAKRSRSDHSVEIFHLSAPAALPRNHALFVLPPDENPLVSLGKPLSRPLVSSWNEPHPLTRYINFALFRPSYSRPLQPRSFGTAVIESPEGPLAVTAEREGFRYLVLGFDPFPFLGRDNLPVSIFTLNLLDWFYGASGLKSIATGEPLVLSPRFRGGVVTTPLGEKLPIQEGRTVPDLTLSQGIYEISHGQEKELVAVNLQDTKESDLTEPAPIRIKEDPEVSTGQSVFRSLWPYLLLFSILLLLAEWFLNLRATRSRYGVDSAKASTGL